MVPRPPSPPLALARALRAVLALAPVVALLAFAIGAADTLALLVGLAIGLSAGVAGVVYQPDRASDPLAPQQMGGR